MIKIKVPRKLELGKILILYIFGTLYLQLIELFLPFSVTKLMVAALLLLTIFGVGTRNIKCGYLVYTMGVLGFVYLCAYFFSLREIFSYVYPPIIVAIITLLMLDNFPEEIKTFDWKLVNWLIFGYLIINAIFYIFHLDSCFQFAGGQLQFKGALPHTNMFGSVFLGLFVIIFWQRSTLAWINKIIIIILMLTTYSRTYILVIFCCLILQIMTMIWRKISFTVKAILSGVFLLIVGDLALAFGTHLLDATIAYLPFLARFRTFQFGGNGRQYLQEAFVYAVKKSRILGRITGAGMTKSYLEGISVDFAHSFTENSFMGIYMLFGTMGMFVIVYVLYRLLKMNHNGPEICIIAIVAASMLTQDTLLSIETGLVMCFAVIVMYCQGRFLRKQKNP